MISNIAELVQKTNPWLGFLLICLIIIIIYNIVIKTGVEIKNDLIQALFLGVYLFSIFCLIKFFMAYASSNNDLDEKINTIVEENVSTEAKKEKIITYIETEKFFGNISSYENLDNNFKIDDIYEFTITDSE
ncbi:hypothetical protein [uncultured Thomasclavelia sp.]|uniref:hypothetical protein n=1 Tax=uncultured Thomasclavelia sp. TaxID=3025759 RepID=UPI00280AE6A3|nr:hypothetical protein [uncultured Thomasclavelia sp.]